MDKVLMPLYVRHGQEVILLDVRNKHIDEAEAILRINGFDIEIIDTIEKLELPPGTVIDQQPPPGYIVKRGRLVKLVVSKGESYYPMPNLVGKVLKAAKLELDQLRIPVEAVLYRYSSEIPEGVVAGQSIEPGLIVSPSTPVTLIVSKGPPEVVLKVPDLIGLNLEEAKRQILKAGFEVGKVRYIPDPEFAPFTVVGQRPEPHEIMDYPTAVDLNVTALE
jgi:serine/threonine-protein kinase